MKSNNSYKLLFVLLLFSIVLCTCKTDSSVIIKSGGNYPEPIAKIILNKCAVSGCHNDISKEAASGLSLTTWDHMFEGTRNGAAVIPYNHKQSTLFLFSNVYKELGVSAKPTMPYEESPLTKEEVITLRNWIDYGAPNEKGFVKFSDNPLRSKFYVCNQGCDLVTVFDAATALPMRCFEVGQSPNFNESPHQVRVSPDGRSYYVIFLNGTIFQKFNTADDSFVSQVYIGHGSWNTFVITADSKYAYLVDYSAGDDLFPGQGRVKYIDLSAMEVKATYNGPNLFSFPHAVALHPNQNLLYVFGQEASFFYKVDMRASQGNSPLSPEISGMITMDQSNGQMLKPHDVLFSPDGDKYMLSCQNTNEVRFYSTADDHLIKTIPVGTFPQELAISNHKNYLFVSCMEDTVNFPGFRGSIAVIDLNTLSLVKHIYTGHQPHGIAVDESFDELIIANRNNNANGPAPHHSSDCGGRNGYITFVDINTLKLIPQKKIEVSVDPYFISVRP